MSTLQKEWFAVDVIVDPAASEAIESAFNQLESIGSEINSLRKSPGEPVCVTGYFEKLPSIREIHAAVNENLSIAAHPADAVKTVTTRQVENEDWLAEWKRHWKPTEVGRFVIAPPWSAVSETDKIIIRIEPNMAFGTGTHETTQLCLNAIGENFCEGYSFLDVGTGTGILAIAAAKLSETSIIKACDTNFDSVEIAKENAKQNGVGKRIDFVLGPLDPHWPVRDFVCANLTLDVILPILPLLIAKSRYFLLLSGILTVQEPEITEELQKFEISDFKFEQSGEWISVAARIAVV